MSYFSKISYEDSGALDAFSRLRTSTPETLFQVQTQYDACPLEMETGNTGTGTAPSWSANDRMVLLSGTAGTGTSFIQSYQYTPYQPGKSQFIACTGVLGSGVAGWTKDFGYFDASNGIFYRQNGTSGLEFVLRSSTSGAVVDTVAAQADWTIDKMNGSGVSRVNLLDTKCFILIIDLQFLSMGRVRIGFDVDGKIYYAHEFKNANVLTVPYMQTATLPVQALLTGNSTAAPASCYFKCATVQAEGGNLEDFGYQFSTPLATATAGNGAFAHILSVRPKTTFNGITNRTLFILDQINLIVTGNNPILWQLVTGATFSVAPTWANVNATHSAFEYATGGTYSTTGGIVVASGFITSGASTKGSTAEKIGMHHPITLDRTGAVRANGTLSLLVWGIGGTSATSATMEFTEVR